MDSSSSSFSSPAAFKVSPSSSTCSLAHLLQSPPIALGPTPSSSRGQRQRRDRAVSSDSDTSSAPLPPAYVESPPPAYTSQPSQTITVTRAAFESLSSRSDLTLEQALALSIDAEIAERARRREAEIRIRLEPLLFPEPRLLVDVVGGLFCRGKRASRRPPPPSMDDLDEHEQAVARKIVNEVRLTPLQTPITLFLQR